MHHTPLHDWHVARSARMVDFAGWDMPIQYASIIDEHNAVREAVGLFDIGHMGRMTFAGPDADAFVDRLITNDVTALSIGDIRYALMCNEKGGILDDVLVYRFDDFLMLVVNASNREKIVGWIDQHRSGFDVDFVDRTHERFMLALQGPRAEELLQPLVTDNLARIKYYTGLETTIGNDQSQAIVSRTGYTGEDGFEVILPADDAVAFWQQLVDVGTAAPLTPCGLGCRDTLRLEAGMPLYGHEMDATVDPYTAGLGFGVKLGSGDFIGKDALIAARQKQARRKRVGLTLDGRRIGRQGATVIQDNQQIGHVTSGTFSPTLQQSIAMGYVASPHSQVGTAVEVDIRGTRVNARVARLPFYQRS